MVHMVNKTGQILHDHNQKETLGEMKMDRLGEIMASNDPNGVTVVWEENNNGQTMDQISQMTGEDQNRPFLPIKYKKMDYK